MSGCVREKPRVEDVDPEGCGRSLHRGEGSVTMNIKAIPTNFLGIQFRSRLEARWAVFMEVCQVKWQYEPEGFDLGDGVFYLPDFWLPRLDCYLEIKPTRPDEDAMDKAFRLALGSKKDVYILYGFPGVPDYGYWKSPSDISDGSSIAIKCYGDLDGSDEDYCWCECPSCGLVGIEFNGRAARLPCPCSPPPEVHSDKWYNSESPLLVAAYESARCFRF